MQTGVASPRPPSAKRRRIPAGPTTRLGRWAVGLGAGYVVGVFSWRILPGGAALGFACGFTGGVLALVAIIRHGERAISVFVAALPLLLVVGFVLAELIIGHD